MGYPQERCNECVTISLLNNSLSCVNQDKGKVCCRCTSYHITGILNVPRRICDNEFPFWSGKVTVCHINGYSLFPLCTESVCEKGEINIFISFTSA